VDIVVVVVVENNQENNYYNPDMINIVEPKIISNKLNI